jgi:hypothetical protein
MHTDPSAAIAAILAPIDRRAAVDRLLAFLVRDASASGGAVLSVQGDDLLPYVVRDIELRRLIAASDLWAGSRPVLQAGTMIDTPEHALAPIASGEVLQALLYLESPKAFDAKRCGAFLTAIGRAMETLPGEDQAPAGLALEPGGKEELISALHRSEWNLARAARMIRCSRRTIYLRMQRYGIPRQKIPKSVRRAVK